MWYSKILIALYITCWMHNSCGSSHQSNMPSFNLLLADSSTIIKSDNIPYGQPIMLLFFSPDCEHCQAETKNLLGNMDALENIRIYFITVDPLEKMRVFNKYYKLSMYRNIVVGRDYNFTMFKNFDIPTTPVIVLFNKYKQERVIIKGPCEIKWLLEKINQL